MSKLYIVCTAFSAKCYMVANLAATSEPTTVNNNVRSLFNC